MLSDIIVVNNLYYRARWNVMCNKDSIFKTNIWSNFKLIPRYRNPKFNNRNPDFKVHFSYWLKEPFHALGYHHRPQIAIFMVPKPREGWQLLNALLRFAMLPDESSDWRLWHFMEVPLFLWTLWGYANTGRIVTDISLLYTVACANQDLKYRAFQYDADSLVCPKRN